MTIDLGCLVANALWGLLLVLVEIAAKTRVAGTEWNTGNREKEPEVPEWVKRTGRALGNHKENFPLFLTAVIVVHLTGHADRTSGIACIVYVVARAAHALLYMGGVQRLRSAAFTLGSAATLVVFSRLLTG